MFAGEFSGAVRAVQSILQREGLRGLYAGYGSFLLRDLPFDAIEFVAYEQLRKAYGASLGGKRSINGLETGAIGAAIGHRNRFRMGSKRLCWADLGCLELRACANSARGPAVLLENCCTDCTKCCVSCRRGGGCHHGHRDDATGRREDAAYDAGQQPDVRRPGRRVLQDMEGRGSGSVPQREPRTVHNGPVVLHSGPHLAEMSSLYWLES